MWLISVSDFYVIRLVEWNRPKCGLTRLCGSTNFTV